MTPQASRPGGTPKTASGLYLTIVAGAIIMTVALGIRQSYGLVIGPAVLEWNISFSMFALAVALHNLIWGVAQPVARAAADRYGATPVLVAGAVAYALGLALTALWPGAWGAMVGTGLLVGIGLSCTGFGTVLVAVGRAAAPNRRTAQMGLASALGSIGGAVLVPLAQYMIETQGISASMFGLAAAMLAVAPFGLAFLATDRKVAAPPVQTHAQPTLGAALGEAASHKDYILLTLGFFTCGFQLAFFAVHFPSYLVTCHLPASLGALALAVFGGANAIGTWICGILGSRYRPQYVLGWIYLLRGIAILALVVLPKTEPVALGFAAILGFLGLGAVPLTSGVIARIFGVANLGMLFGVVFLNHQIGSFFGAWFGAWLIERGGSYESIWIATAIAGGMAALLHFLIDDLPVARAATT